MTLKFDLKLFQELNEEYRAKPLVPKPPVYDRKTLAERGEKRAAGLIKSFNVSGRVLEIGCGRGEVCRALAQHHGCETVGVDVSSYSEWDISVDNVNLFKLDLASDEHSHIGKFDFIYSNAVFEHINHPFSILKSAYSLLKPGKNMWMNANLYRGPKASHRYREVFFPWPHLLFTDEVFHEFYESIGRKPARAAWVNQLSIADYYNYFDIIGFERIKTEFSMTKLDEEFIGRFSDKLERIPRYDLARDFLKVLLRKPE